MEFALLKTALSLIAVLGLMVGVLLVLKRFSFAGGSSRSNLVDIEVLSQKVLQPKRSLYVVKVLNKVMVISSTEHGIQSVGEIADESVLQAVEAKQATVREQKSKSFVSFSQRLRSAETLGDFFHKPFNVILWRGDKPGIVPAAEGAKGAR